MECALRLKRWLSSDSVGKAQWPDDVNLETEWLYDARGSENAIYILLEDSAIQVTLPISPSEVPAHIARNI